MGERRDSDPTRLGDLLGDTCDTIAGRPPTTSSSGATTRDVASPSPERMLAVIWPDVVGAEVAVNTRPVQLRNKRLVVSTSSSVWAQTLQFMAVAIAAGINERLGADIVGQVVFHHAGWEESPRKRAGSTPREGGSRAATPTGDDEAPAVAGALSEEQRSALAAVETLDLTPELRERMLRAMRASFVRGEKESVR